MAHTPTAPVKCTPARHVPLALTRHISAPPTAHRVVWATLATQQAPPTASNARPAHTAVVMVLLAARHATRASTTPSPCKTCACNAPLEHMRPLRAPSLVCRVMSGPSRDFPALSTVRCVQPGRSATQPWRQVAWSAAPEVTRLVSATPRVAPAYLVIMRTVPSKARARRVQRAPLHPATGHRCAHCATLDSTPMLQAAARVCRRLWATISTSLAPTTPLLVPLASIRI